MEQSEPLLVDNKTEHPVEITDEKYEINKPDFVKRIESFDVQDLTPENIEFMTSVIQNYFVENLPVRSELVEQLPEHINVIGTEEFMQIIKEHESSRNSNGFIPTDPSGFYDEKLDKIFINGPVHTTPGGLFATMFHESLHFISAKNGAGFMGNFGWPDSFYEDKDTRFDIYKGINTLNEGTTQIITLKNIIDKMGFNEQSEMLGYAPEIEIMRAIWQPISDDEMLDAYLNRKMDEIRMHVERVFEPKETRDKINPTEGNGVFTLCLRDLGITTDRMYEAMENWGDGSDIKGVLDDIRHAVGQYIIWRHDMEGAEMTNEERETFRGYLELYENNRNREEESNV